MKKIANFIVKGKWIIISIFMALAIISGFCSSLVSINYNISDYLNEKTETKIAIDIIEEEFGMTGNLQVMLSNIDIETAKDVSSDIKEIDNVLNVNFDAYDEAYYKDNKALYVILIDGDDYSTIAEQVTEDVKNLIETKYDYSPIYAGTTIEKQDLKNGITSEIIYILAIALVLVMIILLFTSNSWLEPFILLIVSGIAIIINSGSNFIFKEISYITNSIAAILQLALSIDYSIVLLHAYRKQKENGLNNEEAMKEAIVECMKPVSASGLTTIAGLLALVFMSFTIGFDIGMVLMKGIVISVLTSLTLLPCVLLISDKLLQKSKKRSLKLNGKSIVKIGVKASKIIVPLSVIVIVISACFSSSLNFTYSDASQNNTEIVETFGTNNTLVVVFENEGNDYAKQQEFIDKIKQYEKETGSTILLDYTSYINTVREELSILDVSRNLDLSIEEATQLFEMYHLYNNQDDLKLDFNAFIDYAYNLVNFDKDAIELVDESTKDTIIKLKTVNDLLINENTVSEFYTALYNVNLLDTSIDQLKQLYGMYAYDTLTYQAVDFKIMLDFIILMGNSNEMVSSIISTSELTSLQELSVGIDSFNSQMDLALDKATFQGMMYQNYQTILTQEEVDQIYASYFLMNNIEETETISYLNIMNHLVTIGKINDETMIKTLSNYTATYEVIHTSYKYDEFPYALGQICYGLTGTIPSFNMDESSIYQIYIMYFNAIGAFDDVKIKGIDFVNYTLNQYEVNPVVQGQMSNDEYNKLKDMKNVYSLTSDTTSYNYSELANKLNVLQESMLSMKSEEMSSDKISGVYIKYAIENDLNKEEAIMTYQLLDFVTTNKGSNYLLKSKLDEDKLAKLDDANEDLISANKLLISDKYSRMLLSLDLENDSKEATQFIEFIKQTAKETLGENTYITGELMSTYDLKESFEFDNMLITIITIISIFLIVLLIFKSLSLPILLVAIIQGAIWITCLLLVIIKSNIFFMSYIVSTCILMGATIDYGILMSNTYVEHRENYDKKESLVKAVETALPTIFTSGLILIICGFVIGFISSQVSISTVGKIIGIGTVFSVIMILFVLPSVLYLLDGFVMKFTKRRGVENEKL